MLINKSSHYDGRYFRFKDRIVHFQRAWGGISFEGKFLIILGEERYFTEDHLYVLCEAQYKSLSELADSCRRLGVEFSVDRWTGTLDANIEEFIRTYNIVAHQKKLSSFCVTDAPRIGEYIDTQLNLVYSVLQPEKRLHFFDQSLVKAEMLNLPDMNVRAKDFPRMTALANVVSGLLRYTHDDFGGNDAFPDPDDLA